MKKIIILSLFTFSMTITMSGQSDNYSFTDVLAWAGGVDPGDDPTRKKVIIPSRWKGPNNSLSILKDKTFQLILDDGNRTTIAGVVDDASKPPKLVFTNPTAAVGNCSHYTKVGTNKEEMIWTDCNGQRIQFVRRKAISSRNFADTQWKAGSNTLNFLDQTRFSMTNGGTNKTDAYSISAKKITLTGIGVFKVKEFNAEELILEDSNGTVTRYTMVP